MEAENKFSDPSQISAAEHYRLGLEGFKKGYLNVAFTHFSTTVEMNPNSADALYHIGLIYSEMENHDLAERHYHMALGADPNHAGVNKVLGLDAGDSSKSPKKVTETDFFERLKTEGTPEAEEFMKALEKMDFKQDLKPRSHGVEYALRILAGTLKLLFPAAFAGFLIGMGISAMGFGSFLPVTLLSGTVIFLVQIMEKFR